MGLAANLSMSHKRSKRQRKAPDPLNDQKFWSTEIRPPFFEREIFQARLDLRAGKNRDGKSVLILRWAPEVYTEMFDGKMPRYWVSRIKDGEGFLYTSPPRWLVERRLEREQYVDSWNANRWIPDVDGSLIDKGPPPDEYHIFTWLCAEHGAIDSNSGEPKCCRDAWVDGRRRCWGTYRHPNDYDLQCVEAAVRRRDDKAFADPYAPLSAKDLQIIEASSAMQLERLAAETAARQAEILRDQRTLSDYGATTFDMGQSLIVTPN